ncbi:ABC transporter permease [Candidatus Formimonas warabiya]|uniref:ABC transmembrane type-1 domain-containing protein n=1 Tax=Formimonas warabiya TaxID=1761012 RepID=A0A3G1KSI9_FORW1|nr:ABC transporter permease subunit [Candidatus Formimonas warabiya]ATW25421.1 hypothetical protein DCMF_12130 [Candidatus Formimonas warabiya]
MKRAAPSSNKGRGHWFMWLLTVFFLLYTFLPLTATLFFSLAQRWTTTVLPESWTIDAYVQVFSDPAFAAAMGRSLFLSVIAATIQVGVVLLALLAVNIGKNRLGDWLEALAIIPVALPGVVLAIGAVSFYGEFLPVLLGQPVLLIGTEAAFGLPFVYWTLQNSFRAINVKLLYEAACTLRCTTFQFLTRILIPSLKRGIAVAGAMAFATAFDDFALAQLIVGAGWETYPVLLNKYFHIDGHQTSAMSMIAIIIVFLFTSVAGYLSQPIQKVPKEDDLILQKKASDMSETVKA